MKCSVHQERDAVGVCTVCGRGICESCTVTVNGKLYCKSDVEKAFSQKTWNKGTVSAKAAAIIFLVNGLIGLLASIILTMGVHSLISYAATVDTLPLPGNLKTAANVIILFAASIPSMSLGSTALNFFAADLLWKMKKDGGALAIASCISDATTLLFYAYEPLKGAVAVTLLITLAAAALVAAAWPSLR